MSDPLVAWPVQDEPEPHSLLAVQVSPFPQSPGHVCPQPSPCPQVFPLQLATQVHCPLLQLCPFRHWLSALHGLPSTQGQKLLHAVPVAQNSSGLNGS